VGDAGATPLERSRAIQQARLPVKMGGLGLTSMTATLDAACVGKWALCWHQMRRLCPQLFAHVDVAASPLPALRELRSAHKRLQDKWMRMDGIYREIDSSIYDYDKFGEAHRAYRPPYLPGQHKLEPITAFGLSSKFHFGAQREYSLVVHHAAWFDLLLRLRQSAPRREAARLIAVSQPYAGAFLNAVPKYHAFQIASPLLRIAVQRRLGLPVSEVATATGRRSRHGLQFDALGDVAQNDGREGHAHRHFLVLEAIVDALRRVMGRGAVEKEPSDYKEYSDHRPDMNTEWGGFKMWDLKLLDVMGSSPGESLPQRAAAVGFGATAPHARALVRGREARGVPGTVFNPMTGRGWVSPKAGDYARPIRAGLEAREMVVETFGGLDPNVVGLVQEAAEQRQNRLTHAEFEREATWATRKYVPFVMQRISIAVQIAAASEIRQALGRGLAPYSA
jgi:hypothetical protein